MLLHKVPYDRPIQLVSRPSPFCNGIFVVFSLCTCQHPASTIAQLNAEEVGQAVTTETNAPGRQIGKCTPIR